MGFSLTDDDVNALQSDASISVNAHKKKDSQTIWLSFFWLWQRMLTKAQRRCSNTVSAFKKKFHLRLLEIVSS